MLCNKILIVSLCSNFGTLVRSPQTMFQLLIMTLFAIINTQPSNMQGERWILIANFRHELYFADSLGREKYSFSTTSTTSRRCQHSYSLTQVYGAFIQCMQHFISSSFSRKKLQEFTMLMYSLL